jgi:RNase P/RNase MRP subunit p29
MIIKKKFLSLSLCSLWLVSTPCPSMGMSQQATSQERQSETTIEGTVVSSTRDTLVVRTEENQFQLFTFNRYTVKSRSLAVGSRVKVVSTPGEEAGVRLASTVTTLAAPPRAQGTAPAQEPLPPPAVRELERDIKREVRRWRLGVRAGVGLDPELVLFGVHSQLGPLFHRDVSLRPNAEFAFGEVTDLIALNLEAAYRLPISSRQGRWSAYIGAGPAFTFLHQNFEREAGEGRDIDFGNFEFDTGFNILTGVQFRKGTFFEVKSSVYSRPAPSLRLIFGYNF